MHKKQKKEWFYDSKFWELYAPIIFDENRLAEVPIVADSITRLARFNLYGESKKSGVKLTGAPRVLDLCCGFGRISAELAQRGFSVTGIDINKNYLKKAKKEAVYKKLDIEYIHSDARKFSRPDYFDLAVNLYVSFGYCENSGDDLLILENVYNSLKNGGVFIMETLGKEIAVRDFIEADWFERAGYTLLTEYEPIDSWTRLKNRWILIDKEKRLEKVFTQRLYAASELRDLFFKAGFDTVEIFGNWDESKYDQNAEKLIIVAKK